MRQAIKTTLTVIILMLLFTHMAHAGSSVTISGKIIFKCDFAKTPMEAKFGHYYIKDVENGQYKTNLFGANTEVVIRDSKSEIVGLGKTNKDGVFKLDVEPSNFYKIEFEFMDKQFSKIVSKSALNDVTFDLGMLPFELFSRQ